MGSNDGEFDSKEFGIDPDKIICWADLIYYNENSLWKRGYKKRLEPVDQKKYNRIKQNITSGRSKLYVLKGDKRQIPMAPSDNVSAPFFCHAADIVKECFMVSKDEIFNNKAIACKEEKRLEELHEKLENLPEPKEIQKIKGFFGHTKNKSETKQNEDRNEKIEKRKVSLEQSISNTEYCIKSHGSTEIKNIKNDFNRQVKHLQLIPSYDRENLELVNGRNDDKIFALGSVNDKALETMQI